MEHFLTPAEAGRLLGLVAASVRRLATLGTLPTAATTEGGIRLFRREEVLLLVQKRARRKKAAGHA
jgi:DNA-binding transcriptional MerR regulator